MIFPFCSFVRSLSNHGSNPFRSMWMFFISLIISFNAASPCPMTAFLTVIFTQFYLTDSGVVYSRITFNICVTPSASIQTSSSCCSSPYSPAADVLIFSAISISWYNSFCLSGCILLFCIVIVVPLPFHSRHLPNQ